MEKSTYGKIHPPVCWKRIPIGFLNGIHQISIVGETDISLFNFSSALDIHRFSPLTIISLIVESSTKGRSGPKLTMEAANSRRIEIRSSKVTLVLFLHKVY